MLAFAITPELAVALGGLLAPLGWQSCFIASGVVCVNYHRIIFTDNFDFFWFVHSLPEFFNGSHESCA